MIEGVGSLSIITAPSGDADINEVGHLSCFFKNGESFYSNLDSIEGCEPTILGVNQFNNSLSNIIISTNPTTNSCRLDHI
ncbi:MAG: hypothetical protein KUG68_10645, partial [Flavobacteriaceae bacterium]|nr:hypothetical protein [Flavobacteriaceae bacterium]